MDPDGIFLDEEDISQFTSMAETIVNRYSIISIRDKLYCHCIYIYIYVYIYIYMYSQLGKVQVVEMFRIPEAEPTHEFSQTLRALNFLRKFVKVEG